MADDVGLDLARTLHSVVGQLGKYRSGAVDYVERATSSHRARARRKRSPPWPCSTSVRGHGTQQRRELRCALDLANARAGSSRTPRRVLFDRRLELLCSRHAHPQGCSLGVRGRSAAAVLRMQPTERHRATRPLLIEDQRWRYARVPHASSWTRTRCRRAASAIVLEFAASGRRHGRDPRRFGT